MITGTLIHPQLLAAVARAGHGAHVLVLDGHYPASTAVQERAELVHLNLAPGLLDTSTVLRVLLTAMTVESAAVMVPPAGEDQPQAVTQHLADLPGIEVDRLDRWAFYEIARSRDVALAVVTGDVRTYANLLLTVGVRQVASHDDQSLTQGSRTQGEAP
ncbi:RbsD/FucU domain-containing protein [Aeromicrobium sp. Root344]|uniref:RbsD/FucU domain-containing protein n=1 Tax=Aeromicrobium sp. Root344 TaxID=1736521 RepID=UPI0009E919D7|nr:RbsD/FucU domain-containing protein [Aeromicrobium sp. Root344]